MKYSSSNKPLVCMQTQSSCYKGTSKMTVKGILLHSTGANNKTLKRYVQPSDIKPAEDTYSKEKWLQVLGKNAYGNDWNHTNKSAGLNCWIGTLADGTVTTIQTMPWDYKPWGCGSGGKGSCNNGWIQFEICEDNLKDAVYFNKVYTEACEISAYLCEMFKIDPQGSVSYNGVTVPTILCHKDSYALGLGSNHSDIYHWFTKYGKDMNTVRNDVAALMKKNTKTQITTSASVLKFKKGDIVDFVGGMHYSSASAASGSVVKASRAKITATSLKGRHPYHCRAVNSNGKFIDGVYGWVDASAIKVAETATKNTSVKTNSSATITSASTIKKGSIVSIVKGAKYYNGASVPNWVVQKKWVVKENPSGNRVIIDKSSDGKYSICSAINSKYLAVVSDGVSTKKTLNDWAKEVVNGKHGNGAANRTVSLKKAGCPYTYKEVQARVNELSKK